MAVINNKFATTVIGLKIARMSADANWVRAYSRWSTFIASVWLSVSLKEAKFRSSMANIAADFFAEWVEDLNGLYTKQPAV